MALPQKQRPWHYSRRSISVQCLWYYSAGSLDTGSEPDCLPQNLTVQYTTRLRNINS